MHPGSDVPSSRQSPGEGALAFLSAGPRRRSLGKEPGERALGNGGTRGHSGGDRPWGARGNHHGLWPGPGGKVPRRRNCRPNQTRPLLAGTQGGVGRMVVLGTVVAARRRIDSGEPTRAWVVSKETAGSAALDIGLISGGAWRWPESRTTPQAARPRDVRMNGA